MNGLSWSALAILLVVCHATFAAPSARTKRQDELSLDPVSADVSKIYDARLFMNGKSLRAAKTIKTAPKVGSIETLKKKVKTNPQVRAPDERVVIESYVKKIILRRDSETKVG